MTRAQLNDLRFDMKTRTPEERAALLIKAKILDENGNYHKDFFRPETVEKSKARKANAGK